MLQLWLAICVNTLDKTAAAGSFGFLHFLNNNLGEKNQITDRKHLNDRIFKRDLVSTNIALLGPIIEEL